jgi:hypothetical protein
VLILWFFMLMVVVGLIGVSIAFFALIIRLFMKRTAPAWKSWWVGGPLMLCLPGISMGILGFVILATQTYRPASSDYNEVFGVAPTPSITNLRGLTEPGFDSRVIYLAFDYNDTAWSQIIGSGGFSPISDSSGLLISLGEGSPAWWRANNCADKVELERKADRERPRENGLLWDDLAVVRCKSDGKIYVLAGTID